MDYSQKKKIEQLGCPLTMSTRTGLSCLMSAVQVYVGDITYTKGNHEGKTSVNDFRIIHGTMLPLHLCK